MVLYLNEYEQTCDGAYLTLLHYYDKQEKYLHKMKPEEILEHINRNGVRSVFSQKLVVRNYLQWLADQYSTELGEEIADINYNLEMMLRQNDSPYIGIYTLDELKKTIETNLRTAEVNADDSRKNIDFGGLKAFWFLEWYGVRNESAISIKLNDVSGDGKQVYVPAEKRTIQIDDVAVADYFAEYKAQTSFKKYKDLDPVPYSQDTFYRTTSNATVKIKTIYNSKEQFKRLCPDDRFEKKRLYYSGRYYQMMIAEEELNEEFMTSNLEHQEIIKKIFHSDMSTQVIYQHLLEYQVYKKGYMEHCL